MANDPEPHLKTNEARAGSTPGMTRPILVISLVLIVVIMAILLIHYH